MVHYKQYKASSDFFSYSTIQSQPMRTFEIQYRTKPPCTLLTLTQLQIYKNVSYTRQRIEVILPPPNLNSELDSYMIS